jgi:hypothetical protein
MVPRHRGDFGQGVLETSAAEQLQTVIICHGTVLGNRAIFRFPALPNFGRTLVLQTLISI